MAEAKSLYGVYREFVNELESRKILVVWRYYKDGRAWLGKAVKGSRTVCWISLWEGYFLINFTIAHRLRDVLDRLKIDEDIRERAMQQKPIGKLLPILVELFDRQQLADLRSLVDFKLSIR